LFFPTRKTFLMMVEKGKCTSLNLKRYSPYYRLGGDGAAHHREKWNPRGGKEKKKKKEFGWVNRRKHEGKTKPFANPKGSTEEDT